jgi:hypothetical protein
MHRNIASGEMELVNAGHPAPLLIRNGRGVQQLESATTLPVDFGSEMPRVRQHVLQRGDRVLCYTDGIIEEHVAGRETFGEERLIRCVNRLGEEPSDGVGADLRRLSHTLKSERGGRTTDDAALFMRGVRGHRRPPRDPRLNASTSTESAPDTAAHADDDPSLAVSRCGGVASHARAEATLRALYARENPARPSATLTSEGHGQTTVSE